MDKLKSKNEYSELVDDDGENYIKFVSGGKYKLEVLVDKDTWENYLHR